MPFTSQGTQYFGDGADAGTSTQLGTAELDGLGNAIIRPISGLGTDTITLPAAALKAKLDRAILDSDADPTLGFTLEIVNAPGEPDPASIAFREDDGVLRIGSGSTANYQDQMPATAKGLQLALAALGL